MRRNEMVREVLDLYDRIAELEAENSRLKACKEDDPNADVDARILKIGREKLVDECLGYWRNVGGAKDDDGRVTVETYEHWLGKYERKYPEFMSAVQFRDICAEELKAVYQKECKITMDALSAKDGDDE